jgi:siroheme synthase
MGFKRAAEIAATLLDDGWRSRTPAAVIADATTCGQQVWRGTLADLAAGAHRDIRATAAATIVVGTVVAVQGIQEVQGARGFSRANA